MNNLDHWLNKFRCAFVGLRRGAQGQSSFVVHFLAAAATVILAVVLRCELWQWVALLICIAMVLGLEYVNSAIENLARGLCQEKNEQVGAALDTASAAVLIVSIIALLVGLLIFGTQLLRLFNGT